MKHKHFFCIGTIVAVISLFFSGCSESGPDKISLKDAMSELENYSFGKYENLNFDDCKIIGKDINELYKLKVKQNYEDSEEVKKRTETLFFSLGSDIELNYSKHATAEGSTMWVCMDNDKEMKRGCQLALSGSFDLHNAVEINGKKVMDESFYNDNGQYILKADKVYDITDDITDIEYKVGGEMYRISDAVAFAEKYVESIKNAIFDEKETAKVSKIAVVKNDEYQDYAYKIIFRTFKNGVVTDCNGITGGFESDGGVNGEHMLGNSFDIMIPKKDSIMHMSSAFHVAVLYNQSTRINEIIPLSSAEKILADTLAPLEKYNIVECGLEYCCRTRRNAEERYYEPMWVFVANETFFNDVMSTYQQPRNFYVNAVTGECFMYHQGSIHSFGGTE